LLTVSAGKVGLFRQRAARSRWSAGRWLIPGGIIRSNSSESAARFLKFDAYCPHNNKMGETMNIQHSVRYPIARRALAIQDFLMVTAFGAWALVLGLSPVLVFHALT
jgi:hypothetical protein